MPAQRMAGIDARVLEVTRRVVHHAQALHDAQRGLVGGHGDRDHLVQAQAGEGEFECRPRRFGRITAAPGRAREPPADLDR